MVGLLVAPSLANAKPGYIAFAGGTQAELGLKGSHGYAIQISGSGRPGVELFVSKRTSVALYLVPRASFHGDRIKAEFPGVGRVSVEFHPSEPARRESGFFDRCKGGESVTRRGYFGGVISIHGERGYTSAHATRAEGQIVTTAREVCKRSMFSPQPASEEGMTRLSASSRRGGRLVAFYANTIDFPVDRLTYFVADVAERKQGMQILRQALVQAPEKEFALSDASDFPSSATVTPPAPFTGSAIFQRNPGTNSWLGSLSVELPGAGPTRSAGSRFEATLCQDSGCPPAQRQIAVGRVNSRSALRLLRRFDG